MTEAARREPGVILLAEDDPGDQKLIKMAFARGQYDFQLKVVIDGNELVDYLNHSGEFVDASAAPRPSLVLLDLNMPRKDGRTALREIKSNDDLRRIPIVVLTTSDQETDIVQCYDLGANSFITKPSSFPELAQMAKQLERYWFELSKTPSH